MLFKSCMSTAIKVTTDVITLSIAPGVSRAIDPGYFEINTEFGNFVHAYPATITFRSQ
jgi:hypothetical protein